MGFIITKYLQAVRSKIRNIGFIYRRFLLRYLYSNIKFGRGFSISENCSLSASDAGIIQFGSNCHLSKYVNIAAQKGVIKIDCSVFIGICVVITSKHAVTIGRNVLIAERVTIRDQDHAIHGDVNVPINQSGFDVAPIVIGDDVWIAAGAVILKGVTIGRGAVVGANAVVNRDVAEYEIVGGVPAKHLGFRKGFQPNA